ncbi:MAG: prohibitin family protein, partial [Oscillospiraceae bacterium]|nr:prohibitin family protein [Oscillospiraceae bacterium]
MPKEKVIDANSGSVKKIVTAVIIIFLLIVVLLNSFTTVKAGHSGVVTTFGKVSEGVLSEGLHFKIPFIQNIILIDNRVQKAEASCSSASKDLQTVSSTIAVNYKVLNGYSASVYKNIGMDYESVIITPAIQECVKAVTAKFTAEELITNRQSVGDQMMDLLKEKIGEYGIEIQIFNITAFDFTDEYNAAIEAKQTAQQNALKAQQDLQRIKVEAE